MCVEEKRLLTIPSNKAYGQPAPVILLCPFRSLFSVKARVDLGK